MTPFHWFVTCCQVFGYLEASKWLIAYYWLGWPSYHNTASVFLELYEEYSPRLVIWSMIWNRSDQEQALDDRRSDQIRSDQDSGDRSCFRSDQQDQTRSDHHPWSILGVLQRVQADWRSEVGLSKQYFFLKSPTQGILSDEEISSFLHFWLQIQYKRNGKC